jgi:hypothetical protein
MIPGDVIRSSERPDGLLLKLVAMDSGAFRIYMCNPPGEIVALEYKTQEIAEKAFDRIAAQRS